MTDVDNYQVRLVASDSTDEDRLLKVDSNRYLYVHLMAGIYTPQTAKFAGSDCSGTDGATGRVLTLTNANLSSQEMVTVDGQVYRETDDYTVSHLSASSTITFVGKIWDSQKIEARYFI